MNFNSFITTEYRIRSRTLPEGFDGFRAAVLADLHNCRIGGDFRILLKKLEKARVDVILLAGDLVTETGKLPDHVELEYARHLIRGLTRLAPVYYGFGNHEMRWQAVSERLRSSKGEEDDTEREERSGKEAGREHTEREPVLPETCSFGEWQEETRDMGVVWLDNSHTLISRGTNVIRLSGLNLPRKYYAKFHSVSLTVEEIEELLGPRDPELWQILLAHTPMFTESYMQWGADLALAGHYHGGVVRLPFLGGVISTNFRPFPRYDKGCYPFPGGHMVVSAGLGCHTIPVRINNPPELVILTLRGEGD